MLQSVNF